MSHGASRFTLFLGVTPRLEEALAEEVSALALGSPPRSVAGGIEISTGWEGLWTVVHRARLVESVRLRLRGFAARTFEALQAEILRLPWSAYFERSTAPRVEVTSRHSRLFHQGAVKARVEESIRSRLAQPDSKPKPPPTSTVHLRIYRDQVQVSVDASGDLLHRRGYRRFVGKAPLRETIAAAGLWLAKERITHPVWDPFCGSGTFPIEAVASWMEHPAPLATRRFAFEEWPVHDAERYRSFSEKLERREPASVLAWGSDIDLKEVEAARANARLAGVAAGCQFLEGDFEEVGRAIPAGCSVVTNLPYGRRARTPGGNRALEKTFSRFGDFLRSRADLRPVFVLCGYRGFQQLTRLDWRIELAFQNRGIPVALLSLT